MSNQIQSPNIKKFDIKAFDIDLAFGFWILTFFSLLSFLIPLSASAASFQYHFSVAIYSPDGAIQSETTIALPVDSIASATAIDLGDDGTDELIIGAGAGLEPRLWLLRQNGSIINSWLAYDKNFRGGAQVAVKDAIGDERPEIIVARTDKTGRQIKIFDGFGKSQAIKKTKINLAALLFAQTKDKKKENSPKKISLVLRQDGAEKVWEITAQSKVRPEPGKLIAIDLSEQKLSYYQDGFRVNSFSVSTGRWNFPTPIGEFAIQNHIPRAYSRRYGLYMPWWMAFYKGEYGIHELPEWPNGAKEGESHLGTPVSHGCIRLGVGPAKTLYDWAGVGTKVVVQK